LVTGGLCIFSTSGALATTVKKQTTSSAHSTHTSQTKKQSIAAVKSTSTVKGTKKRSASSRTPKVKMQMAPTSDRIREIQTALAASDAYKGEPTGKWDAASVDAMKHFQQVNGLNPTGKLDAHSLQKLGLGSETAGRGAPRPGKPAGLSPSSTTSSIQR
jgi:peptidoglycan hydrolase-like protein with peptidoglycan-binding domain